MTDDDRRPDGDRSAPDEEGASTTETDADGEADEELDLTFEDVDWTEVDAGSLGVAKTTLFAAIVFGSWLLAVGIEAHSRFVADTGRHDFPVVGTVAPVDWLWVITLFILLYFGVIPLARNPRMTKYYWKEFRKNKAAVISGLFLTVVFLVGVVGARILPDPEQTPGLQNQPPAWMSVEAYVTGPKCPGGETQSGGTTMCQGSWEHPLGTTSSGEDILLTSIHGMEVSMQVGLIATLISVTIAAAVALSAAHYGGLVDEVLMRFVDLLMTFPTLILILLMAYVFGGSLFILICIFGFFGWGSYARIMRSEALQRREEPYIQAARSAGSSSYRTIRRHLLPNISNSVITAATLSIPAVILGEATVAFLGLGDPTTPSWGRVIAGGRNQLTNAWWISTFPGFFLFFTVLAFNFLGDALRDALDPRQGGSGE